MTDYRAPQSAGDTGTTMAMETLYVTDAELFKRLGLSRDAALFAIKGRSTKRFPCAIFLPTVNGTGQRARHSSIADTGHDRH
jgi:hypothetical protein